jgi:hypothetical membrane protein
MNEQVSVFSRMAALVSARAALWAAVVFVLALVTFSSGIEGYSHLQHPVAWLGAGPLPRSGGFNLFVFVLPGLLVAWTALRFRTALSSPASRPPIGWSARIGAQLVLLSALAFMLQGVLPLDANDLDGARSGRHAAAWMVWWIAFTSGAALLAIGLRAAGQWRATAAFSLLTAVLVPACALVLPQLLPAGLAQRLAFVLWFAWAVHADGAVNRNLLSAK